MTLEFEGVSAAYGPKKVLDAVSFRAEPGTVTALIGPNGAGKSTLIHCLTGQKGDCRGHITLDGRDVKTMTPGERASLVACLPQSLPRPHVTVRELVSFGRTPYIPLTGKLSSLDREKIQWAIGTVGLQGMEEAFVDTLSGGERKKAFFAMTLAQDTPVVLLDEPTAHLDIFSRFAFLELVDRLCRETGKTFLVILHDLPEVLRWAHRIVVLQDRQIAFAGSPEQCLATGIPQRCFRIRITGSREQGYAAVPDK